MKTVKIRAVDTIKVKLTETVVSARGLVRRFGSRVAVDGIDLDIHRGEVFGFLGPNGAGKSTLLRMLVGLLPPSSGEAEVLGFRVPGQAERLRERIGYMTQKFSLYTELTVVENLEFAGQIFGLVGRELRDRVGQAIREYSLYERSDQRVETLSGGWKQRLALAVATLHRPEILVLDEPTAGVDPASRREFWERLFELAAQGTTLLVSTHYMDEATRCHRICLLLDGRVVATGNPRDLEEALHHRVLEVISPDPAAALPLLRDTLWVVSVTQLGSRLHVVLAEDGPAPEEAARQLTASLTMAGVDARCEPTNSTLEDAFVALTARERAELEEEPD